MLKFRLPYSYVSRFDFELKRQVQVPTPFAPETEHPGGTVLLPVWTRPTSTECRLVVPQYAKKRLYNHQHYEDQMFFFNAVVRERAYFRHEVDGHEWVTHHFDGAAEVAVVKSFLVQRLGVAAVTARHILDICDRITVAIGGSFERAWRNREGIHTTKGAKAGWLDQTEQRLQAARNKRALAVWRRQLTASEETSNIGEPYIWCLAGFTPEDCVPSS